MCNKLYCLKENMTMLKQKYEVRMATSGMQALTLIGKKKPDMIFLDYEMPVVNGKQVLEMIKTESDFSDIPVIFLTSKNDAKTIKYSIIN